MKFGETFNKFDGVRPVFSFEVFPPKTDKALEKFQRILPELINLSPDFITVTYGAMGSTQDKTLEIARSIKAENGIATACHLTCVGSTSEEIEVILNQIHDNGIENIVALRGDPPQGETEFKQKEGGYAHAIDLVRHIKPRQQFGIAVAGYPEKHIEASDMNTDLEFLKEKVDAGADVVITQLFYDNQAFFKFHERARSIGITCPIVPGILPILSAKQVKRITSMCGTTIPPKLQADLNAAGDDNKAALEIGIHQAIEQVTELLDWGVPGIHFYVLNRSSHMQRIFSEIPISSSS